MIKVAQSSLGDDMISTVYDGVAVIQCVFLSGQKCDALMYLGRSWLRLVLLKLLRTITKSGLPGRLVRTAHLAL